MENTFAPPSLDHEFDAAFKRLIGHEGGYVHHPHDPGGETKFGITKRSYPNLNIKKLTLARAKNIYKRDFWDRLQLDQMPQQMRYQVFDAAVNSDAGNAARWLQEAVDVAPDGYIGPITLQAVALQNPAATLAKFNGARLHFMTRLSRWPTFSRGWARRIAANLKEAK